MSFSLNRLLAWLDGDAVKGDERYLQFHKELVAYLQSQARTVAEDLADEALNRVDERLTTSLLNEHFNSTEISDVPGLCRILKESGAPDSTGLSQRIWSFLAPADQSLVTGIALAGTFKRPQRTRLSQALNDILRRRDFYRAEDFDPPVFRRDVKIDFLIEKIEADIARGLAQLAASEIETFNRRLLDAAYPQMININLADTPDAKKLARCKNYAGKVLLEYLREPHFFKPSIKEPDEASTKDTNAETAFTNPLDSLIEKEAEDKKQRKLACQRECKGLKLSPRDRAVLDLYYTGIIIRSPEDEPLSDSEIKIVRKRLAEKFGVSPETIRTIVHRRKEKVLQCINRCMMRQEKN
jgi:hypothetical protein